MSTLCEPLAPPPAAGRLPAAEPLSGPADDFRPAAVDATRIRPETHPTVFCCPPGARAIVLVDEASRSWTHGHAIAAAMLCRAALELHVRQLCQDHPRLGRNPRTDRHRPITCVGRLFTAGVIDRRTAGHIRLLLRVGNSAAHTRPVSLKMIERLLHATHTFIAGPVEGGFTWSP